MSVNICGTTCMKCSSEVMQTGPWLKGYELAQISGATNMKLFGDRLFCYARCWQCGMPYIGWGTQRDTHTFEGDIKDLSFRSSFNDEPGKDDVPTVRPPTYEDKIMHAMKHEMNDDKTP